MNFSLVCVYVSLFPDDIWRADAYVYIVVVDCMCGYMRVALCVGCLLIGVDTKRSIFVLCPT